ncbi:MAG TPA: DUF3883 domain-containing protein [Streptosporangiaceae bacterium]|nr:DUF3883 domain-containing protein [Streptosporangiaceae bacterium]
MTGQPAQRPAGADQRRAVAAVLDTERALGRAPRQAPAEEQGYDVESRAADGTTLFIVVRDRPAGAGTFLVTRSELGVARNTAGRHVLALVDGDRVRYVRRAFAGIQDPPFGSSAVFLPWQAYFERGQVPQ